MAQYNLIFQGEIVDGASLEEVKIKVAQLFNANAEKTNILFSGKAIVIKKNLDSEASKKYIAVLKKAGAVIHARKQVNPLQDQDTPTETPPLEKKQVQAETPYPPTASEELSSNSGLSSGLSALVNYNNFAQTPSASTSVSEEPHSNSVESNITAGDIVQNSTPDSNISDQGMQLAPIDSGALPTEEPVAAAEIKDISHLSMAEAQSGSLAEFTQETAPVELPDISALSMSQAETGSLAGFTPETIAVELPDISELSMSDAETVNLAEFTAAVIAAELPDISELSMSEAQQGSLEGIEKKPQAVKVPDTSHLELSG
ncbi:MAG: hypothetical protein KZQ83_20290 [gamma proteobacterium symbiont of Taylorina sp.]|nr:hypothetical protein [gamma proteobacterium symbiont of Taylorina sp.]